MQILSPTNRTLERNWNPRWKQQPHAPHPPPLGLTSVLRQDLACCYVYFLLRLFRSGTSFNSKGTAGAEPVLVTEYWTTPAQTQDACTDPVLVTEQMTSDGHFTVFLPPHNLATVSLLPQPHSATSFLPREACLKQRDSKLYLKLLQFGGQSFENLNHTIR